MAAFDAVFQCMLVVVEPSFSVCMAWVRSAGICCRPPWWHVMSFQNAAHLAVLFVHCCWPAIVEGAAV